MKCKEYNHSEKCWAYPVASMKSWFTIICSSREIKKKITYLDGLLENLQCLKFSRQTLLGIPKKTFSAILHD